MPALASFYDQSSLVSSLTYGNGSTKGYVYDDQQRIKQTYVDNTLTSLYNYDRLGNLVKYSDAKTGLTWNHEYDLIGRATRSDANGHRTQKTVNGVTTNYYWVGDRLQYMATGDDLLVFLYDDKGTPYGMLTVLDGVQQYFFYLYNAQGDVIAIIDDYAERVVNYEYSAWASFCRSRVPKPIP